MNDTVRYWGWLCARCGRSNAPWMQSCPCGTAQQLFVFPQIPYRIPEPYTGGGTYTVKDGKVITG
jgi:hypothetical protein